MFTGGISGEMARLLMIQSSSLTDLTCESPGFLHFQFFIIFRNLSVNRCPLVHTQGWWRVHICLVIVCLGCRGDAGTQPRMLLSCAEGAIKRLRPHLWAAQRSSLVPVSALVLVMTINSFNGQDFSNKGQLERERLKFLEILKGFGLKGTQKETQPEWVQPVSVSSRCLFLSVSLHSRNMW